MARIPMSVDVAALVGAAAEKIENRSLLLDKFSFHKLWPVTEGDRGRVKWDEATRWSFVRIANGAAELLKGDAGEKRRRAGGQNVGPENRDRLLREARIADTLASVSWDKPELTTLRASHTRRFLGLLHLGHENRSKVVLARLEGRLAINLADSLIKNAGIALDRLFGLPYVPGSAIKGVARAAAYEELCAASGDERMRLFQIFRSVFGTADNDFRPGEELDAFRGLVSEQSINLRGAVAFLPAYPVNDAKVVVDLTNVHLPEYYRSGNVRDLGRENLQPNPFPCVEAGARFAFCLMLTRADSTGVLLTAADRWLRHALTVRGLGAKTAAGYGWFSIEPDRILADLLAEESSARESERNAVKMAESARSAAAAEIVRKAALKPEERLREELLKLTDQDFAGKVLSITSLAPDEQRAILLALTDPTKRDRWKKWKKSDKDTDKKRVAAVTETAKAHHIVLP